MARPDLNVIAMLCALITLTSTPVSAAEAPDEARAHYQLGATAYHEGRYDEAAREFQAAYDLDPRGPLLLNIAQAYRLRTPRDCGEALRHYELFLAAQPNASEKPEVIRHVAEMRACVTAERTIANQPVTPTPTDIPAAPLRQTPAKAQRPTAALWIAGAGLASAAIGGGLYLAARDRYSGLSARCPCPDDADAQGAIDHWENVTQSSYVLSGVGLAALIGAGSWWLFGATSEVETEPKRAFLLRPMLLQGGAAFVAEGWLW